MNQTNHSASSKTVKQLVAFGKKCSKTLFPNLTRTDCPSRARLRAMAFRDRQFTIEELPIAHVVQCSPCFEEYQRLRGIALLGTGLKISFASIAAFALCFAAVHFIRSHTHGTGPRSIQEQARSAARSGTEESQPPAAPAPIRIDLAAFSPTRGDAKASPGAIHLPQKFVRVAFQMPVGLEPGDYTVQLKDAAGALHTDTRVLGKITDGLTSIEVNFDLRATSQRSFTLMIRPPGLSWRTFPVVVE
jgi:hypothetical protein